MSHELSESRRSSAPLERQLEQAFFVRRAVFSTTTTPFRVNIQAVEPVSPRLPPLRVNA